MSEPQRILRVLNGRQAGSEKPMPAIGNVSIGPQYWQNVVIRAPETEGVALDLEFGTGETATLTVMSGTATLLGSTIDHGGTALVPPYVPFSIGGIALAWGETGSPRWDEAGGLANALPAPPTLPPTPTEHARALADRAKADIGGLFTRRRLIWLGVAVALLVVALSALPVIDALHLRATPVERVQNRLNVEGLTTLRAVDDPVRGVLVQGIVAHAADRNRAQAAVEALGVPATFEVRTGEELAQASAEVARVQGLEATARPVGVGVVELHTIPLSSMQRDKLMRSARSDVPGLNQLILREDLQSQEDAAIKTVADVTKKVSTVVAGDPAYIQTADGARYFIGAIMPTGHRLVAIEGQSVVLDKNGRQIRLSF